MKRLFFIILSSLLVLPFSGCGYTTQSTVPSGIHTLHIEPFKNSVTFTTDNRKNLYLPLLEVNVRNAVIDRFLFDGHLKISTPETADWILRGELKNYERSGLRFTDNDNVEEYRVTITVSLELFDPATNEVLWSEPSFSGEGTYFVTGPQARSEDAALQEALADLARRIVERTVENW